MKEQKITNFHNFTAVYIKHVCAPITGGIEDTGSYVCLWADCNEEFYSQKTLVDHVNDSHMDTRKGCEEFPCLWKVR